MEGLVWCNMDQQLLVVACHHVQLCETAMLFNNTDLGAFLLLLLVSFSSLSCYNFLASVLSLKYELWPKVVQTHWCYLC